MQEQRKKERADFDKNLSDTGASYFKTWKGIKEYDKKLSEFAA